MSSTNTTLPEDRVPLSQKLAVGAGGFPFQNGSLLVQYMAQPVFQIFLGVSPWLMGLAMTIPRIWDAFTDPIMGKISDNFRSRFGRRRPFVLGGSILMALTFMSIWMVPRGLPEWATVTWLIVTTILFFTAFTVFSVPLTSLTYELTPDYHERTRVMAFFGFFFTLGNLFVNWYAPATEFSGFGEAARAEDGSWFATWMMSMVAYVPAFIGNVIENGFGFSDRLEGARYVALFIGSFVFIFLGSLPAIFGRERFYAVACKEGQKIGFITALKQAVSSKPMLALVGLIFALNFVATIAGSIAQYIVIYHVMGGDVQAGIALNALNGTGFAIIGFVALPILSKIATKFGKRPAMMFVLVLACFGGLAKWFIFTPDNPNLLLLDAVLNGPIWASLGIIIPSMMADLCDWDEHKFGERREGIISAAFTWVTKVGLSFTFLVSGIAISISGFDETLGVNQPEGTITTMRLFFVGASVLAPVLAILCLQFFEITEEKANEIRAELEARRGKA